MIAQYAQSSMGIVWEGQEDEVRSKVDDEVGPRKQIRNQAKPGIMAQATGSQTAEG